MNKARLIITAIQVEAITQAEAAHRYGVSQSWVSKLLTRYRLEGDAAFTAKPKRPHSSPTALPADTVNLILRLRQHLTNTGHDAGGTTIAWHLNTHHNIQIHPTTIWRYLKKSGAITPQPQKRPRSSYIRFQAELPNETWQSDFTHYRLTTGADTEIITWLDDHSRYALHVSAHHRISAKIVLATFQETTQTHAALSKAKPDPALLNTESRVRYDKVDTTGCISFRHAGKMHHIGIGRHYKNTRVIMLVDGIEIRIVDQQTCELLRELTLDTSRDYQPQK